MKQLLSTLILGFFFKYSVAQHQYIPKYKTLAHELVAMEQLASNPGDAAIIKTNAYQHLLDSIIDACKTILPEYDHDFNQDEALQMFTKIDSTLYSFGFYVCVYVSYLSDALAPINTEESNRKKQDCKIYLDKNPYRKKLMEQSATAHKMDCDISSIIYYSIAQVMNYPVFIVEVPDHDFVRWRNPDDTFFNWDTNSATSISNDCYKYECDRQMTTGFNDDDEKIMNFLIDMDTNRIKAYYLPFIGLIYQRRGKFSEAENIYKLVLSREENNIYAMYYLAYLYLYDSAYSGAAYKSKAYELANKAFTLLPHKHSRKLLRNEVIETCACAEASAGDFIGAIEMVKQSSRNKKLIKGFKAGKKCYEIYPYRP